MVRISLTTSKAIGKGSISFQLSVHLVPGMGQMTRFSALCQTLIVATHLKHALY